MDNNGIQYGSFQIPSSPETVLHQPECTVRDHWVQFYFIITVGQLVLADCKATLLLQMP